MQFGNQIVLPENGKHLIPTPSSSIGMDNTRIRANAYVSELDNS